MKRLLMFVGVAVVAAAMYVAASPASQQSKGVSVKQFNALKKTVTAQGKTIKTLKEVASIEAAVITDCDQAAVPIDQFGNPASNPAEGYHYQLPVNNAPTEIITTGLDVTDTSDTGALYITGGDSTCGTLVNGGLRHAAAKAGITLPHASSHAWSFAAH